MSMNLRDLRGKYEAHILRTYQIEVARDTIRSLERFFDRYPEKSKPEEFLFGDVHDYLIWSRRRKQGEAVTRKTLAAVRTFWYWMITIGAAEWNPVRDVLKSKPRSEQKRTPLPELDALSTVQALLRASQTPVERALVLLVATTGVLESEIVLLPASSSYYTESQLRIPEASPQTKRGRLLPIREDCRQALLVLAHKPAKNGRLFGVTVAGPLGRILRILCHRAGLPSLGFRFLRSAFATFCYRGGLDVLTVHDLLGLDRPSIPFRPPEASLDKIRAALDMIPLEPELAPLPLPSVRFSELPQPTNQGSEE